MEAAQGVSEASGRFGGCGRYWFRSIHIEKYERYRFRFIHIVKCTCDSAEQSFRAFGRISCGWMVMVVMVMVVMVVMVVVMTHEVGEETK